MSQSPGQSCDRVQVDAMLHPFAYAIDRWLPRQPRGLDKRHRTSRQANTRSAIDRHATVKTQDSRVSRHGLDRKGQLLWRQTGKQVYATVQAKQSPRT